MTHRALSTFISETSITATLHLVYYLSIAEVMYNRMSGVLQTRRRKGYGDRGRESGLFQDTTLGDT
jgi:hypothetical protein